MGTIAAAPRASGGDFHLDAIEGTADAEEELP
jgi:hypothetical protein